MEMVSGMGMNKSEFLIIVAILLAIGTLSIFNFGQAERKGNNVQRKNDLKHIAAALADFQSDIGSYPVSIDNKIGACGEDLEDPKPCDWGKDAIFNPEDPTLPPYINPLPEDPLAPPEQYSYLYLSDGAKFQLFAHLDGQDDEYNEAVEQRGLMCGPKVCNFGLGSGNLPSHKSFEEIDAVTRSDAEGKDNL